MIRRAALVLLGFVAVGVTSACAPVYPQTSGPVAPDARLFYVGGYLKQAGVLLHGRIDVTISAIGGRTDPGRPGQGGFGGIPDGPTSAPWEASFAIERAYDKTVTVNLTLTYIAPAFVADELTCYVASKPVVEWAKPFDAQASPGAILDTLTVRSNAKRSGSSVMIAYCVVAIPPLQN